MAAATSYFLLLFFQLRAGRSQKAGIADNSDMF